MASAARFAFGENWADYAKGAGSEQLESAIAGVKKLLPDGFDPGGKSFLDVGCGSGLHSIAAFHVGFDPITAVDYDENSVATTNGLASRFGVPMNCFRDDILNSKLTGKFDVVYSWGVLHHTGNMAKAVGTVASLVAPGGVLIVALYLKTPFCGMWTGIKRAYSSGGATRQRVMAAAYIAALKARGLGSSDRERGMDFYHDAIDWLGGYPYESATPAEAAAMVGDAFTPLKSFNTVAAKGLLGTGCSEYVFERV